MSEAKETIYIDVDEEITGIVSKVQNSRKEIVALVLPKRASVLQSIVNMKLLKRATDQNDKQVVLITSEARLLPLAGAAKIFVAPNLTSKPYIPPAPSIGEQGPANEPASTDEVALDKEAPLSSVAPDANYADDAPLEIDNTPKSEVASGTAKKTKGKDKKQKIPNFNSFRKKAFIFGLIAALLIAGLVYAFLFAPKAKIVIKTKAKELTSQFAFVADTSEGAEFSEEDRTVPATQKEVEKSDSEKVQTTGERDDGKKASGTITMKNCSKTAGQITVPGGTGVSSGEYTFVTQQSVTLPASIFTGTGACITPTSDVSVVAQEAGDSYNLSSRTYTVAGKSGINATGSDMKGGTTKKVKIVSQKDIDLAKERLSSKQNSVQDELKKEFEAEGYVAVPDTFKASQAEYNPSPGLNSESPDVTVSTTTKYTMVGVKRDDLKKLIEANVKEDKGAAGQILLKDGIDKATFKIDSANIQTSSGKIPMSFETTVVVGPELNQDQLRSELAGKKKGPAIELLKSREGVIDPNVELSPFWVSSIPGKASRVTFEIQQADGTAIN